MFDAEAASFVCEFIEYLTCSNGAPFRLMDWQRDAVTEFYGQMIEAEGLDTDPAGSYVRRYQYLYLEIAKKNGKSELAAALGVYHLYADGEVNGEVYVVAADRDNAGIVYSAAKWMVEHSPALMKRSRIVDSTKTIYDTASGSKLKVLSSEAYSKHGYKPSCVIFDELHAQPNRDLWDVMTFGAGDAREQPVWIVLTTAGDDPDRKSIGWEVHEKALSILRCRNGCACEGDMDDPRWLPIICTPSSPSITASQTPTSSTTGAFSKSRQRRRCKGGRETWSNTSMCTRGCMSAMTRASGMCRICSGASRGRATWTACADRSNWR